MEVFIKKDQNIKLTLEDMPGYPQELSYELLLEFVLGAVSVEVRKKRFAKEKIQETNKLEETSPSIDINPLRTFN